MANFDLSAYALPANASGVEQFGTINEIDSSAKVKQSRYGVIVELSDGNTLHVGFSKPLQKALEEKILTLQQAVSRGIVISGENADGEPRLYLAMPKELWKSPQEAVEIAAVVKAAKPIVAKTATKKLSLLGA